MKIYMQLAGYKSDGVSSDCINRIGDTEVIETTATEDIIAKANEMMVAAKEQRAWRPVILLATEGWHWAPDTRPGWYMGGRWLFSFDPERDAEQLATTMMKQQVIGAAQFACSPEGHKRGSGAMRRLKKAVAEHNNLMWWEYPHQVTAQWQDDDTLLVVGEDGSQATVYYPNAEYECILPETNLRTTPQLDGFLDVVRQAVRKEQVSE